MTTIRLSCPPLTPPPSEFPVAITISISLRECLKICASAGQRLGQIPRPTPGIRGGGRTRRQILESARTTIRLSCPPRDPPPLNSHEKAMVRQTSILPQNGCLAVNSRGGGGSQKIPALSGMRTIRLSCPRHSFPVAEGLKKDPRIPPPLN